MATLDFLLNALKVAFGLGFVIFLHELGHFVLAKWNGVKVEKFSIGFGSTLLGFTRGETEYVLAAVPLGGFVKMLGEGTEGDETNKSIDPRAYPNKSVGARMAIISAGVIMNLVLGLACFFYAHLQGMDEIPTSIGAVKAGSPAYEAGIRPGDDIIAIDGRANPDFKFLTLKVRLSGHGQKVRFLLKRPGREQPFPLSIQPRRDPNEEMPGIGVAPNRSLTLAVPPYLAPAGAEKPAGTILKPGDTLLALGPDGEKPEPIRTDADFRRLLAKDADKTIVAVFERTVKTGKGKNETVKTEEITAVLPPTHFVDFGFRLTIEPIASVQPDSPASRADFRKGDTIVEVDGDREFDPMRLPTLCHEKAGKEMTFVVKRPGKEGPITLTATPDATPPWTTHPFPAEPLKVDGLGLCYPVRTSIVGVRAGSPAAKAGLKPNDVINSMIIPALEAGSKPEAIAFDEKSPLWPDTFATLQVFPKCQVKLTLNGSKQEIPIAPEPDPTWFHPRRGLGFPTESIREAPGNIGSAFQHAWNDTVDNVLSIYAMLRSLWQGRVSTKALGGPPAIIQAAYHSAATSWTHLVYFLGFLSINLAVINFLPIPPLDGGQMAFLIAEKVRGRPLPESAVIAGSWLGIVLVLCVMVLAIYQDTARMLKEYFF